MKEQYADKYLQLGLKIAYYRKLRGLTQEQLAEELGRSPAFIGHVEAPNINKAISLDTLFGIAEVLDVVDVAFLRRHAAGRGVGLLQVPVLLKSVHLVADGRR